MLSKLEATWLRAVHHDVELTQRKKILRRVIDNLGLGVCLLTCGARGPILGTLFQPCVAARLELMNSMNTRQPSRRQPRQVLGSPALLLYSSSLLPKRILCSIHFGSKGQSSSFISFPELHAVLPMHESLFRTEHSVNMM